MTDIGDLRWQATFDQAQTAMANIARAIRAYYNALAAEGFAAAEAMRLAEEYHTFLLSQIDQQSTGRKP